MKFSPDGEYLASAGKDGIVRVWKVVTAEAPKDLNSQDVDPSCLYFSLSHLSKLASLDIDKEKIGQLKKSRKSSESACVILPPKVFRILQQPVHEFYGHVDEVLALYWSRNGYLLSSSVDKTARLWQVGHDQCLGVYPHNNYVTCVEFNPVDDNYFISGSIDGKVRLWEVQRCRVIDWTDVKEIVTAVCYFPDGKGGVVGSMDGAIVYSMIYYSRMLSCCLPFSGNRLEMGSQVSLQTRKRITGFQFCLNAKENNWISGNNSKDHHHGSSFLVLQAAEILEVKFLIFGAILARTKLLVTLFQVNLGLLGFKRLVFLMNLRALQVNFTRIDEQKALLYNSLPSSFVMPIDAGKSTIGGQILFLSGQVDERTIQKYEKEAKDKSRESW
nr:WD repeat-containing protein 44-like [Ipomoea trifida]